MNKIIKYCWSLLLFVLFAAIFIYKLFQTIPQFLKYQESLKEYDAIIELAYAEPPAKVETPEDMEAPENVPENFIEDEPAVYESPINFSALLEINPEICGWICIEGTAIDYPIVHTSNNITYLSTTFKGKANPSGAIFADKRSTPNFTDKNTVIYGHNMKNGSMFAALTKYKEQSFFDKHPNLIIYTPEGEYIYDIISAYITPADSLTYTFEFSDSGVFDTYLKYITDCSMIKTGIDFKNSERIITLSTCDYTFDDSRMIVHASIRR